MKRDRPSRHRVDTHPRAKRFLFLFSDTGGGHRASSQAVKDEMTRLYGPAADVEMVDVFQCFGKEELGVFEGLFRRFSPTRLIL